jgi:hypothetical protein
MPGSQGSGPGSVGAGSGRRQSSTAAMSPAVCSSRPAAAACRWRSGCSPVSAAKLRRWARRVGHDGSLVRSGTIWSARVSSACTVWSPTSCSRTQVAREFFRAEHGREPVDARELAGPPTHFIRKTTRSESNSSGIARFFTYHTNAPPSFWWAIFSQPSRTTLSARSRQSPRPARRRRLSRPSWPAGLGRPVRATRARRCM